MSDLTYLSYTFACVSSQTFIHMTCIQYPTCHLTKHFRIFATRPSTIIFLPHHESPDPHMWLLDRSLDTSLTLETKNFVMLHLWLFDTLVTWTRVKIWHEPTTNDEFYKEHWSLWSPKQHIVYPQCLAICVFVGLWTTILA